jgi:hypothetical protein
MGSAGRYEIGTASIGAANTLYCPSVAQRNEHISENALTAGTDILRHTTITIAFKLQIENSVLVSK